MYLRRCSDLTDEGVIALSTRCRDLRELNVGGCPSLSDASLQSLGNNSSKLRSLNVSKSTVSHAIINGKCDNNMLHLLLRGTLKNEEKIIKLYTSFVSAKSYA